MQFMTTAQKTVKKKKKEIENKERTAWKAKGRGDIYANKRKGLLVN